MTTTSLAETVPASLRDKLQRIRRRGLRVSFGVAFAQAVAILLAAMFLAMFIDWLLALQSTTGRTLLTAGALVASAAALATWLAQAIAERRKMSQIAAAVDRAVPQLEERWSTVTELDEQQQISQVHPAMLRRVTQEAAGWEPKIEPADVVSPQGLLQGFAALLVLAVLFLVAVVADWQQTFVLIRRFCAPQSAISFTQVTSSSGDFVVARGEPAELSARQTGRQVEESLLVINFEDDETKTWTIFAEDEPGRLTHHLQATDQSFDYQFQAGDGQSAWHHVVVANRPELAAVRFRVTPPAYTQQPMEQLAELPTSATVIEHSRLVIEFRPRETLDTLKLQIDNERTELLTCDANGWYRWEREVTNDFSLSPIMTEPHGLSNRHPPVCHIRVYRDRAPAVKILNPEEEIAVNPDDEVEIEFQAEDDFAIGKAELVVHDHSSLVDGMPIELAILDIPLDELENAKSVRGTASLDLSEFPLQQGHELSYSIRVYDTRQVPANQPPVAQQSDQPQTSDQRPAEVEATLNPAADQVAANDTNRGDANGDDAAEPSAAPNEQSPPEPGKDETTRNANTASQSPPQSTPLGTPATDDTAGQSDGTALGGAISVPQDMLDDPDDNTSRLAQSEEPNQSDTPDPSSPDANDTQGDSPQSANSMTRRMLDLAQSASSDQMRLRVDEHAGSYVGRQREKLALALAPIFDELDRRLKQAELQTTEILSHLKSGAAWHDSEDRRTGQSSRLLEECESIIETTERKTSDTPYAFVGLQLSDIGQMHVVPGREALWMALQSTDTRVTHLRTAQQEIARARERLAGLNQQFDRIRRDHRLADALQQIKKMYQVFIEDSFLQLGSDKQPINNYQRQVAEFELDDEYLQRLQEILEMRRELMAELSRILAEDPRLLRRYMDLFVEQKESLRDQLTLLAQRQARLESEVRAWQRVKEEKRAALLENIRKMRLMESAEISELASRQHERYLAWLPLNLEIQPGPLATARDQANAVAAVARELYQQATVDGSQDDNSDDEKPVRAGDVTSTGRRLYDELTKLDTTLRAAALDSEHPQLSTHVINRLADVRQLITKTSAWVRKMKSLEQGSYHRLAAVDQHQLATETEKLVAALSDIQTQLSGMLQQPDGNLPDPIAVKAQELMTIFDSRLAPSQLGASFALRQNNMASASLRLKAAVAAFADAERLFDEMIQLAIEEMDKLPVQDPIADLLNDPTLDELLAMLENERLLEAALGIPPRSSNLQIIGDWLRPGSGGGGGSAGMRPLVAQHLQQESELHRRKIEKAYQATLKRALGELQKAAQRRNARRTVTKKQVDWNTLASQLEDELLQGQGKQPPERYRRAIEQYFNRISRAKAGTQ